MSPHATPATEAQPPSDGTAPPSRLLGQSEEQLRFETLLADLSASFVHLPTEEIDGRIERGLQEIAEFLRVERSSVAQFSEEGDELVVTHAYALPGFPLPPFVNLAALLPWYTQQVRRGRVLCWRRLPDDLPPEAVNERALAQAENLRSHLVVPFDVGSQLLGGLGFASFRREVDWSEHLVRRLQLVGEVFANALARKRSAEREARLREQLARAGRVSLVGQLAASIAHEVNQPLCAVVSNAQAAQRLLADGGDPDEVRAALRDIVRDGQRASDVLNRARGLLRQAPTQPQALEVNGLVREVAALLRHDLSRRGVSLRLDLAEGLPPVRGDRVQLQQVILNLLTNGAEAMRGVATPRELLLSSRRDGAGVAVAVCDRGVGLAPAHLDRIFDPFFTTKAGGMGMGLPICKSIVAAHGGTLRAGNNDGCGTTFLFTLPALREGPP